MFSTFYDNWFKWCPTSDYLLNISETKLLNEVKSTKELFYVPIFDKTCNIRTIRVYKRKFISDTDKCNYFTQTPIVMIHGLGAGLAMFNKNFDALCEYRQVYSFDLIGFGNSSRIDFPVNNKDVENKFVQSIEEWRKYLGISKMILVGHSLGGYLSYAYGIQFSERVSHIFLVDAWGFRENTSKNSNRNSLQLSFLFKVISYAYTFVNPLFLLRVLGPFGPSVLKYVRQDLGLIFRTDNAKACLPIDIFECYHNHHRAISSNDLIHEDTRVSNEDSFDNDVFESSVISNDQYSEDETNSTKLQAIYDYVYHCNVKNPSGEKAFRSLASGIGQVAQPMLKRVCDLDDSVECTFIYGGKSWMDWSTGYQVQFLRHHSVVNVQVIDKAGHHVYAEASKAFNEYVNKICLSRVDQSVNSNDVLVSP